MIVRTDAVILRGLNYGETSRILTLFTRRHGVIGTIAKGARRPGSRFGSALQPLSIIQAVYYFKPERDLQLLTEAAHSVRLTHLGTDLDRTTLAMRAAERVRSLLHEGERHAQILDTFVDTLAHIDSGERPSNTLFWFELYLASSLGFSPRISREAVSALRDQEGWLHLESGAVEGAAPHGSAGIRASTEALRGFASFTRCDLPTSLRIRMRPEVQTEIESLIDAYLHHHVQHGLSHRVTDVRKQLQSGPDQRTGD